jgi:rifampicin phosphotransferase
MTRPLVLRIVPPEVPPASEIGGKGHNLARLQALGCPVPPWIVLAAGALDGRGMGAEPPDALRAEVAAALDAVGLGDAILAVRSSAANEDSAEASFAGQFDSVLGVPAAAGGAALWDAIRRVWASADSERAAVYRRARGSGDAPVRMAILLQQMVDAAVSGVAFSSDPVSGDRDTAVIGAVYGLGEGLVSGDLDADSYHVHRGGEVRRDVRSKERAVRLSPAGGTQVDPVPAALQDAPALSAEEARCIAGTVRRLAAELGGPQDVEWALAEEPGGRRLVLLQTRPIVARPAVPAPPGERRVWDNSNIIESYCGVTTPLTFSFARSVYEDVYRQFCRLMGVSETLLEAHREVFAGMLGFHRGRVYYNLLNWYRALALLPGYGVNRGFMERMMGVRQKLEDPPEPPYVAGRREDSLRLARMAGRLLREHVRLPREVARFHREIDATLAPLAREEFSGWSPDDLQALYGRLERDLLRRWRAPLVNDFFAMIWFGVLGRLAERWLPDAPPSLVNDLLCGEGGIISTEPARRMSGFARRVAQSPTLSALFAAEPEDRMLWRRLASAPEHEMFYRDLRAFLDHFGDRCANELKLETVTLGEDPAFLLGTIRAAARGTAPGPGEAQQREEQIRSRAEALVRAALRGPRRRLFGFVLRQTRARIRDRENLRFERTRVFGLVRRVFVALGRHLAASGRLGEPRDIFYLTREEVFACLNGTGGTHDLCGVVRLRRAEFERYGREPPPPDRFETFGPPGMPSVAPPAAPVPDSASLRGTGCCPGVVRAPVRIVRDPREAGELRGHILAAERTDPGWTLLFPLAAGLLVERGSLLSHSAIVARETGLPCIVGVGGLMAALRDGEWLEMDGGSGTVRRLGWVTDGLYARAGVEEAPG